MTNTKEGKAKTRLQLIVRIVVSTGLMAWLITMIDWDEAFRIMKEGSPFYFVACFFGDSNYGSNKYLEMENAN